MAFKTYMEITMFPVECPRCGKKSYVLPPQSEAEYMDIKCGHCPWYPFYYYGGNDNWREKNIEEFQTEQY